VDNALRASARVLLARPGAVPNRPVVGPHRRAGRMRPRRDLRGGRRAVVVEAEAERPDGEREQQQRKQR
jgi:hypothetical protein